MKDLQTITKSLRAAVDDGDLGKIAEGVSALETFNDAEANPRQACRLTLDEFGVGEFMLDEKWTNVTWLTCPDGISHEVWVRSEKGGYLVFTVMPHNHPSVGIWLDDKSAEELAAKLHTNCAHWDARSLGTDLERFVFVDQEERIMSIEDLMKSNNPGYRAWAERIPALCDKVDDRMRMKYFTASVRANGREITDELKADVEKRRKAWLLENPVVQQC